MQMVSRSVSVVVEGQMVLWTALGIRAGFLGIVDFVESAA